MTELEKAIEILTNLKTRRVSCTPESAGWVAIIEMTSITYPYDKKIISDVVSAKNEKDAREILERVYYRNAEILELQPNRGIGGKLSTYDQGGA